MDYKIKYPKIKFINENSRIPEYVFIVSELGSKEELSYKDAVNYIEECKINESDFFNYEVGGVSLKLYVEDIEESFKPLTGVSYQIKDKLFRNPIKTGITVASVICSVILANKVEDLKEKLEAETKRADDPSNAGKVLRKNRKN